jgi:hypothetical protein
VSPGRGFADLLNERARFRGERSIRFETQVFIELSERIMRARDAQQQIAF